MIWWLFKFFQLYAPLFPNTAAEKYLIFAVIVIVTIACKDIPSASIAATGDLLFTFSTFCSKVNTFIQDVYWIFDLVIIFYHLYFFGGLFLPTMIIHIVIKKKKKKEMKTET